MGAEPGRRRSRRGAILAAVFLLIAAAGVGVALWMADAAETVEEDDAAEAPSTATTTPVTKKAPPKRTPRRRAEPAVDPTLELKKVWDAAVALFKKGKACEALAQLATPRKQNPAFFADPERVKVIEQMEKAALAELSRAARTQLLEEAKRIAAMLEGTLLDPKLASQVAGLLADAERRAKATAANPGSAVVANASDPTEKERLERHLFRFGGEG